MMDNRDLIHLLGQALQRYTLHDRQATRAAKEASAAYTAYCFQTEDFGSDIWTKSFGNPELARTDAMRALWAKEINRE
jgi:hypothetical protein